MLYFNEELLNPLEENYCLPMNYGQLFGEGPFTTMKVEDNLPLLKKLHYRRLSQSLKYLYNCDFLDFVEKVERGVTALANLSDTLLKEDYSLRISFFKTLNSKVDFYILKKPFFSKTHGLKLGVSKIIRGKGIYPSFLKMGPFCEIFKELDEKRVDGYDELLLTNFKNEVLECSTSNIFFEIGEVIKTPKLQSGVLDGVMRRAFLDFSKVKNINLVESDILLDELADCSEIFISNALQGIRSIECYNDSNLDNQFIKKHHTSFCDFVRNYE